MGKFLLVWAQYPTESVASVHCRRWSQKILWAWLELFKVLLGYPLTPCSSSGQCPQRMRQSRAVHSKLIIWTVLGSSLPAQASQSELDRHSLTLCFWRRLRKYHLWVFRLSVRSDTDKHDDEACCVDESLNLLEPSAGSLAIHRSWLNRIRPLFCW